MTLPDHSMHDLFAAGQSVWLDNIRRDLMDSGELAGMISRGLRGMTSNPSIFRDAIAGSDLYDANLVELDAVRPDASAVELFESVAIADIQSAADEFRDLYDESDGTDGFISLEVSPRLAHDTEGTIAEAIRLWGAVDRPNLMVKVPATPAGIPAIEELIAKGVNINITLIFNIRHYEAVAQAFLSGLERCEVDPSRVASVASVFISRVDATVDSALEAVGSVDALAIRGQVAVSAAKMIYQRYLELFGDDFEAIWGRGAHPQRVLWASTSTKNLEYSDVMYVEELVAADTVNTVPPKTLVAFADHGEVRAGAASEDLQGAADVLAILKAVGINLDQTCQDLQDAGVESFISAFDDLLAAVSEKREGLRS